jgi:hypothetical protein
MGDRVALLLDDLDSFGLGNQVARVGYQLLEGSTTIDRALGQLLEVIEERDFARQETHRGLYRRTAEQLSSSGRSTACGQEAAIPLGEANRRQRSDRHHPALLQGGVAIRPL